MFKYLYPYFQILCMYLGKEGICGQFHPKNAPIWKLAWNLPPVVASYVY